MKRHCKSWQIQNTDSPTLLWLGESVIFLHYRGDVSFSVDSCDSCSSKSILRILWILREASKILFCGICVRILQGELGGAAGDFHHVESALRHVDFGVGAAVDAHSGGGIDLH